MGFCQTKLMHIIYTNYVDGVRNTKFEIPTNETGPQLSTPHTEAHVVVAIRVSATGSTLRQ